MQETNEEGLPTDLKEGILLYIQLVALHGAAELGEAIAPSSDSRFSKLALATARDYFIGKCLVEVQKIGAAAIKWHEAWKTWQTEPEAARASGFFAVHIESVVDEQSLWQRKLVEMLARLICFSGTNEQSYYYHCLLVEELEGCLRHQSEQRDFFDSVSQSMKESEKSLVAQIKSLESVPGFSLKSCWYLKDADVTKVSIGGAKPGMLKSARAQIKEALLLAKPQERASLGYCYEHAFSVPSQSIHFSALEREPPSDYASFLFGNAKIIFLVSAVLVRCQELVGVQPSGTGSESARNWLAKKDVAHAFSGVFRCGDFVYVRGRADIYLAEVVQIVTSKFGNDSYKVRYLANKPHGTIPEDWVTSARIGPLGMSMDACIKRQTDEVAKMPRVLRRRLQSFSRSELEGYHRKAVVEMWNLGLRASVARSVNQWVKAGMPPVPVAGSKKSLELEEKE